MLLIYFLHCTYNPPLCHPALGRLLFTGIDFTENFYYQYHQLQSQHKNTQLNNNQLLSSKTNYYFPNFSTLHSLYDCYNNTKITTTQTTHEYCSIIIITQQQGQNAIHSSTHIDCLLTALRLSWRCSMPLFIQSLILVWCALCPATRNHTVCHITFTILLFDFISFY